MDRLISLDDLLRFPIRADHCDKEHANEDFINGIETVFEYIETLPTVDAIPVEYILKRMDEMNDFITEWRWVAEKKSLIDTYVHDICALARLVYGWRKEE